MVAGTLASQGFIVGDDYVPARNSNRKGFFEDSRINEMNERLLDDVRGSYIRWTRWHRFAPRPVRLRTPGWLTTPTLDHRVDASQLADTAPALLCKAPFAYKDPRFCYTLDAWRPYLPADVGFVCVFREPQRTAESIMREVEEAEYLRGLRVSRDRAFAIWTTMYTHVLDRHRMLGDWLFLHFDQVVEGTGVQRLAEFLDAPLEPGFADYSLVRSHTNGPVPATASGVYRRLCDLSGTQ